MEDSKQIIEEAYNDKIITYDNQSLNYKCVLCEKPMTGEAPLVQHLKSNKHKGAAFLYAVSHASDCPKSLKYLLTPEIERAVKDGVIEMSFSSIHCKVCNKDLNGRAPLTEHLSGSDHKKQLNGPQLRVASFVTGGDFNRAEEPRDVTSPLMLSWSSVNNVRLPPSLTPTSNGAISSTTTTPIPTLTFRNDNKWQTPNGTSLLEPSYPRPPEPLRLYRTQPPQRETSPVRFPDPLSPVQPVNLLAHATKNFPKRAESTEATSSSPLARQTLPLISRRMHNLDPSQNSIVLRAVNDGVLIHDPETLMYDCKVCRLPLNTQQPEDHLKHKTHREKSARVVVSQSGRSPPSLLELLPREVVEAALSSIITTDPDGFMCNICKSFSNGVIPLKQHLKGADHLRKKGTSSGQPTLPHPSNANGQRMENSIHEDPYRNSHSRNDVDEDSLKDAFESGMVFCTDDIKDGYNCRVCNKSLNGLKNLRQHLDGSKHKKLFQKNISDQLLKSPASPDDPDRFEESRLTKVEPYSVNSDPRGLVYIFNYKFVGRMVDPKERRGAEQDTINLMKAFKDMGYEVSDCENLTASQTRNALEEIRQNRDLERVDALIMFFLSHGKEPYKFYAEDREMVDLQQDVWSKFTNTMCPFMKNKPKIIFANYCRGKYSEMDDEFDAVKDIPRDMVTIHAATEGITARRNPQSGTHFVRSLCKALEDFAKHYDLRKIYEELDPICKSLGGTQPKWEDSRFKTFYFNPLNPIMS